MRNALNDLEDFELERNQLEIQERFILIYMLDTNIISYIIKNRDFSLIDKFEEMSKEHIIAVSSITVAELFYGVMKKNSKKLEVAVNDFYFLYKD